MNDPAINISAVMASNLGSRGVEKHLVTVQGVVKRFRRSGQISLPWNRRDSSGFCAVDGVSFHIDAGEIVGLVGESGSGKTTLGKALLRLHSIDAGRVLLDGVDVHALDKRGFHKMRSRYQMIFQNPHSSLNPGMRVMDMMVETAVLHLGLKGMAAKRKGAELLAVVGLADKSNSFPKQLSGGEKRRVGLARVLMLKPRLVIADEPTAGLDASLKAGVVNLMLAARHPQMAYLFISHDLHLIRYVSNRIMVMFRGRLVEIIHDKGFELGLPHHPYTELLLHSFHMGGGRAGWKPPAAPSPADNLGLPAGTGCCYYPHCTRARLMGEKAEICRTSAPSLMKDSRHGSIACNFV